MGKSKKRGESYTTFSMPFSVFYNNYFNVTNVLKNLRTIDYLCVVLRNFLIILLNLT